MRLGTVPSDEHSSARTSNPSVSNAAMVTGWSSLAGAAAQMRRTVLHWQRYGGPSARATSEPTAYGGVGSDPARDTSPADARS